MDDVSAHYVTCTHDHIHDDHDHMETFCSYWLTNNILAANACECLFHFLNKCLQRMRAKHHPLITFYWWLLYSNVSCYVTY